MKTYAEYKKDLNNVLFLNAMTYAKKSSWSKVFVDIHFGLNNES